MEENLAVSIYNLVPILGKVHHPNFTHMFAIKHFIAYNDDICWQFIDIGTFCHSRPHQIPSEIISSLSVMILIFKILKFFLAIKETKYFKSLNIFILDVATTRLKVSISEVIRYQFHKSACNTDLLLTVWIQGQGFEMKLK